MDFNYKNRNISDFGVIVGKANHLDLFNKRLEIIEVPGRSEDLIFWDGAYSNKPLEVKCLLTEKNGSYDLSRKMEAIREYLESAKYENLQFDDGVSLDAFFLEITDLRKINKYTITFTIAFTCRKGA